MAKNFGLEMTPRRAEVLALYHKGLSPTEIGKMLGIAKTTVLTTLANAESALAKANPESPLLKQKTKLQKLVPKAVRIYQQALKDYAKKPELAVNTATNLLKGMQLLVEKQISDVKKDKSTLEKKRIEAILQNKLIDQFGLNKDKIEIEEIDNSPQTNQNKI